MSRSVSVRFRIPFSKKTRSSANREAITARNAERAPIRNRKDPTRLPSEAPLRNELNVIPELVQLFLPFYLYRNFTLRRYRLRVKYVIATVVTRPVVASSPRVAVLTARGVRARRPGPFSGSRDPSPRAPVARRRSGAPPAREVRPRTPSHDFAFGSHAMEATSHVTRPGSLPHVRVVGFEPVPSMNAPEDARKPLFEGLLGGETIAVSSPLSQMLGGSNGKSGSADGSPQSGFFSAQSSDSDRSGDVARRFDNEHAAGELLRQDSMEGTSDVRHGDVQGRGTPPIDIPYARGYRHPRSQRCVAQNAPLFVRFFTDGGLFRPGPGVATTASRRVSREKRRRAPPEPGPRGETRASPRSARGGDRRRRACARRDATVSRVAWRRAAFAEGLAPGRMRFLELSRSIPKSGSIPV